MDTGAVFSECRNYRYVLWRVWDTKRPTVLFIGLNPSAADEQYNDPTIRRCIEFAKSWGYGGFYITNLFAYRHKNPAELKKAKDPCGEDNDQFIKKYAGICAKTVLIWGNHGTYKDRNLEVLDLLEEVWCIKINKTGQPAHPLYLKKGRPLIPLEIKQKNNG